MTLLHTLWCDGYSTIISTYRVWGARVRDQVFRRELHTYIHLDYIRVKFMSFFLKKKRKEKKKGYIYDTTAHNWYNDHFTSISTCEV